MTDKISRDGNSFINDWCANAETLERDGLYSPACE